MSMFPMYNRSSSENPDKICTGIWYMRSNENIKRTFLENTNLQELFFVLKKDEFKFEIQIQVMYICYIQHVKLKHSIFSVVALSFKYCKDQRKTKYSCFGFSRGTIFHLGSRVCRLLYCFRKLLFFCIMSGHLSISL